MLRGLWRGRWRGRDFQIVMAGLVPGIHVFLWRSKDVDARA
jgi:hypothetical protein